MFLKLKLGREEEFKKKKRRTIYVVILGHILVLFLIFGIFTMKGCDNRKPQRVIQVSFASSVPNEIQKTEATEPKAQKQPQIQKKKAVKKTPPKKKWKPLDPSQIKKTTPTVVKKQPKPVKTLTPIKASDIAANLRKNIKTVKFNNTLTTNSSVLDYYDEVSQFLYDRWRQPARSVLSGRTPVVNVEISVDSTGKIISHKISKISGINAMDSSVKSLLAGLSSLPAPPDGAMIIDVSLELSD